MLEQIFIKQYQIIMIDPIVKRFGAGIKPHCITLLAGIFGILILPALYYDYLWTSILLLIASGYCDTLDGAVARFQKSASPLGAALDIMTDRFVESTVIIALYSVAPTQRALFCMLMLVSILLCVTSFLVVGLFSKQTSHKSFYYSPGLIERTEAFIFFAVMIALPKYFDMLAFSFILLVILTMVLRLHQFNHNMSTITTEESWPLTNNTL